MIQPRFTLANRSGNPEKERPLQLKDTVLGNISAARRGKTWQQITPRR